jgi:hypothetical protein
MKRQMAAIPETGMTSRESKRNNIVDLARIWARDVRNHFDRRPCSCVRNNPTFAEWPPDFLLATRR